MEDETANLVAILGSRVRPAPHSVFAEGVDSASFAALHADQQDVSAAVGPAA